MHEQGTREDFLDRYPKGMIGIRQCKSFVNIAPPILWKQGHDPFYPFMFAMCETRQCNKLQWGKFQRSRYQQLPSRMDCAMSDSGFSEVTVASSSKVYLSRSHDNNNCGGKVGILRNKGMGLTASPRVPPSQEQAARSAWLGWGVQGSSLQFLFFFLLGFGWSPQLCQKFIFSKALP